jgi:cytoskeletal protein RodZ
MDPIEKRELKRRAWMRLAAQRHRAGLLRGRVVVLSLICFAVLWGIVFVQMATGNDPVLSAKEAATATTQTASAARREVEATDPRELEPERHTDSKSQPRGEAAAEAEPEFEEEAEFVEAEPLVTSQS